MSQVLTRRTAPKNLVIVRIVGCLRRWLTGLAAKQVDSTGKILCRGPSAMEAAVMAHGGRTPDEAVVAGNPNHAS